jgi:hypothetical protein
MLANGSIDGAIRLRNPNVNYAIHWVYSSAKDVTSPQSCSPAVLQWERYIQELSYHLGILIDFRTGITGHRKLGILQRWSRPSSGRRYLLRDSGEPGSQLEVVLPMSALDETHDLRDEQSRKQFQHLLR